MSPLTPMEQLSRLDSLSPKFTDRLKKILRGQRYRDYVANLQGDDLSPLVEYFDKVGPRYRCGESLLKLEQDLATLQRTTSAYFLCWLELWRICGNNKILPQSHLLSDPDVAERPVASIGPCDVYEGSLGSSKVRVRRLRVYSIQGPKDNKRVRCRLCRFSTLVSDEIAGSLSGGRSMETFGARKYCPLLGGKPRSVTVDLRVGCRWRLVAIRQHQPICRPNWSGGLWLPPHRCSSMFTPSLVARHRERSQLPSLTWSNSRESQGGS